jgi:ferredoxin
MKEAKKLLGINKDLCLKCGGCVAAYPDIFDFEADGSIKVKEDAMIDELKISQIQDVCPVRAIVKK